MSGKKLEMSGEAQNNFAYSAQLTWIKWSSPQSVWGITGCTSILPVNPWRYIVACQTNLALVKCHLFCPIVVIGMSFQPPFFLIFLNWVIEQDFKDWVQRSMDPGSGSRSRSKVMRRSYLPRTALEPRVLSYLPHTASLSIGIPSAHAPCALPISQIQKTWNFLDLSTFYPLLPMC